MRTFKDFLEIFSPDPRTTTLQQDTQRKRTLQGLSVEKGMMDILATHPFQPIRIRPSEIADDKKGIDGWWGKSPVQLKHKGESGHHGLTLTLCLNFDPYSKDSIVQQIYDKNRNPGGLNWPAAFFFLMDFGRTRIDIIPREQVKNKVEDTLYKLQQMKGQIGTFIANMVSIYPAEDKSGTSSTGRKILAFIPIEALQPQSTIDIKQMT